MVTHQLQEKKRQATGQEGAMPLPSVRLSSFSICSNFFCCLAWIRTPKLLASCWLPFMQIQPTHSCSLSHEFFAGAQGSNVGFGNEPTDLPRKLGDGSVWGELNSCPAKQEKYIDTPPGRALTQSHPCLSGREEANCFTVLATERLWAVVAHVGWQRKTVWAD